MGPHKAITTLSVKPLSTLCTGCHLPCHLKIEGVNFEAASWAAHAFLWDIATATAADADSATWCSVWLCP